MNRETQINPREESGVRSFSLAHSLRERILSVEFEVGASLPSERDLMVQYEVSRATIREALRSLGAQGLLEVRRGRKGGSYVCAPSPDRVSDSINLFIAGHQIRFIDLLAVREAIEPVAAAQAALFRVPEDITAIRRILAESKEAIEDLERFSSLNIHWHVAVVRASNNPLFLSIMMSISPALYAATTRSEFDPSVRAVVLRTHTRISDAIEAGDTDAARRRMLRHVSSYGEQLDFTHERRELGTAE
jgi:GntR family transcriptional repressor for pyruvate dehydrogenase complex